MKSLVFVLVDLASLRTSVEVEDNVVMTEHAHVQVTNERLTVYRGDEIMLLGTTPRDQQVALAALIGR